MKDYDCCNYCMGLNDKEYCPSAEKDLSEIVNDFTCDYYVPNFEKAIKERESEMGQIILDEACILFKKIDDPVTFHDSLMGFIINKLNE